MGTGFQVGATGWNLDDFKITAGNGDTLLSDNVEAGGGNFSPTGTAERHALVDRDQLRELRRPAPGTCRTLGVVSDQILTLGQSLALPEGIPSMFVAKIGGSGSTTPLWQWAAPLPGGASADGLATDGAGGVFVAGTTRLRELELRRQRDHDRRRLRREAERQRHQLRLAVGARRQRRRGRRRDGARSAATWR